MRHKTIILFGSEGNVYNKCLQNRAELFNECNEAIVPVQFPKFTIKYVTFML